MVEILHDLIYPKYTNSGSIVHICIYTCIEGDAGFLSFTVAC